MSRKVSGAAAGMFAPILRSSSANTVSWSLSAVKALPAGMPALTASAASPARLLQGE